MNVNTMSNNKDYSRFYRGTSTIDTYGGSASGKKQVVKYEFNTTDENGNKIMDKMSREETRLERQNGKYKAANYIQQYEI